MSRFNSFPLMLTAFLLSMGTLQPLLAQRYKAQDLGTFGGPETTATDINDNGQIVGYSDVSPNYPQAFLWDALNGMQKIYPQSEVSRAFALNNLGQVVGHRRQNLSFRGFVYGLTSKNSITLLPLINGAVSYPYAINDLAQVVGYAQKEEINTYGYAFYWDQARGIKLLTTELDRPSGASSINNAGMAVGWQSTQSGGGKEHPFLYNRMTDIITPFKVLPEEEFSDPNAINQAGVILATVGVPDKSGYHGVILRPDKTITEIPTLGGSYNWMRDLNDSEHVVGYSMIPDDTAAYAVVWKDGVLTDLNQVTSQLGGWVLIWAVGINNHGLIIAQGRRNGIEHAFLLTPIAAVSGKITLLGSVNMAQTLAFTFQPTNGSAAFTRSVTLSPTGEFSIEVAPQPYKITLRGDRWLQRIVTVDLSNQNVTNFTASLIPGDANNDNAVNIFDLATLAESFNSLPGEVHWNPKTDFNCDNEVNILDLALLAEYFNTEGDR